MSWAKICFKLRYLPPGLPSIFEGPAPHSIADLTMFIVLLAIRIYGKNWKKVTQHVGTRISAQVRSHAQKVLKDYSPSQQARPDGRERSKSGATDLDQ